MAKKTSHYKSILRFCGTKSSKKYKNIVKVLLMNSQGETINKISKEIGEPIKTIRAWMASCEEFNTKFHFKKDIDYKLKKPKKVLEKSLTIESNTYPSIKSLINNKKTAMTDEKYNKIIELRKYGTPTPNISQIVKISSSALNSYLSKCAEFKEAWDAAAYASILEVEKAVLAIAMSGESPSTTLHYLRQHSPRWQQKKVKSITQEFADVGMDELKNEIRKMKEHVKDIEVSENIEDATFRDIDE